MSGRQYSVIVADNEPDEVASIKDLLEQTAQKLKDQIAIYTATTGTQVIDILNNHRVDALFLDYHFGSGISGDEIIDRITDPFETKLIFMISGWSGNDLKNVLFKRHKRLGNRFRFLRKPVDELVIADKYLEMEQFFSNLPYPFPLAYAFSVLRASATGQAQIIAIKDLLDVLLRFSVAVLMAELRSMAAANPGSTPSLSRYIARINFQQELTMGAWFTWLDDALEAISAAPDQTFMPELLKIYQGKEDPRSWMRNFKYKVRDPEIGHGFLREEDWYVNLSNQYAEPIRGLFTDYSFTTQYPLFVREQMEFGDDGSQEFVYKIRKLMGAEIRPNLMEFRTPARLKRNEVYIADSSGQILGLSPFFLYTNCPACSYNHLFYLDKINEKQIKYTGFCNQRIDDANAKQEFDRDFGSLFSLANAKRSPDFEIKSKPSV